MKTKTALLVTFAIALAAPAAAQTSVLMIGKNTSAPVERGADAPSLSERVENAARKACEKPFIRDLKGREAYRDCLTEVRAEVLKQLALRDASRPLVIAAR